MSPDKYDWIRCLPRAVGHTTAALEGPTNKLLVTGSERFAAQLRKAHPGLKACSLARAGMGHIPMAPHDLPVVFDHDAVAHIVTEFSQLLSKRQEDHQGPVEELERKLRRAEGVIRDQGQRIARLQGEAARLSNLVAEQQALLEESEQLLDQGQALREAQAAGARAVLADVKAEILSTLGEADEALADDPAGAPEVGE